MFPRTGVSPELYEVQGPVRKVEPYIGDLFRRSTWVATIAVFRDADENGDMNLPVYVTDHVLAGRPPPKVGDDFGALLRLMDATITCYARRSARPSPCSFASPSQRAPVAGWQCWRCGAEAIRAPERLGFVVKR